MVTVIVTVKIMLTVTVRTEGGSGGGDIGGGREGGERKRVGLGGTDGRMGQMDGEEGRKRGDRDRCAACAPDRRKETSACTSSVASRFAVCMSMSITSLCPP